MSSARNLRTYEDRYSRTGQEREREDRTGYPNRKEREKRKQLKTVKTGATRKRDRCARCIKIEEGNNNNTKSRRRKSEGDHNGHPLQPLKIASITTLSPKIKNQIIKSCRRVPLPSVKVESNVAQHLSRKPRKYMLAPIYPLSNENLSHLHLFITISKREYNDLRNYK
jgi:hypothetical protein